MCVSGVILGTWEGDWAVSAPLRGGGEEKENNGIADGGDYIWELGLDDWRHVSD